MKLGIVTATTNVDRAAPCLKTWVDNALAPVQIFVVRNGTGVRGDASVRTANGVIFDIDVKQYLGSVSAFRVGVDKALEHSDVDVIACLHDDLEIHEHGWDRKVLSHFQRHPESGLAGFGGALGLGDADIYQKPYEPQQLARVNFRSNLSDAEVHGIRSLVPEQVACLDGFSQVGRREFWQGHRYNSVDGSGFSAPDLRLKPWTYLENLGIRHHLYDSLLGAIARRHGWETWYLPVRCRHLGGQTAVGDPGYQEWAKTQTGGVGDHAFWEQAHKIGYEEFRDQLPIRV